MSDKVAQLRAKFLSALETDAYYERDIRRVREQDFFLKRYIDAKPDSVDDALALLKTSLKWRREYGVEGLSEASVPAELLKTSSLHVRGLDVQGRPVFYFHVKRHRKSPAYNCADCVRGFVLALELVERQLKPPVEDIVVIWDMQGAGISNLDLDFVKFFIKAFKLHYVGLLHRLLILDMPWVLNAAWRIISAWLDQRAIAKIKFVNKKELQEYIPRDQVLAECGGSDAYVYAFTTGCFPAIESLSEVCFEPGPPQFDSAELERTARTKKQQQQQQARGGTSANTGTSDKKVTFDAVSPVRSSLVSHSVSPANSADFDALLRLSPAKDLLHFKRSASTLSATFQLTNVSSGTVTFKVQTTNPSRYSVKPQAIGAVGMGETTSIVVAVTEDDAQMLEWKDKFLIKCFMLQSESQRTNLPPLWSNPTGAVSHKMRCHFPGQPLPTHTVSASSSSPEPHSASFSASSSSASSPSGSAPSNHPPSPEEKDAILLKTLHAITLRITSLESRVSFLLRLSLFFALWICFLLACSFYGLTLKEVLAQSKLFSKWKWA